MKGNETPEPRLRIARIYVHDGMKRRAESGSHLFLNKLETVLKRSGFEVTFHKDDVETNVRELNSKGYHLRWMQDPANARGLTIRRNYIDPFWKIEKVSARWDWPVVQRAFDASTVDPFRASRFVAQLRGRIFPKQRENSSETGYVLVPLQGRLLEHRSFQNCSPLQMVKAVLENERKRKIILTLHPGEHYSNSEAKALEDVCDGHANAKISRLDTRQLIQNCEYIVTENSSIALNGFLLRKPAILCAGIDFHHIAMMADERTMKSAMNAIEACRPDYDQYIWWFFQEQSINAKKQEAERRIARQLHHHGWPIVL